MSALSPEETTIVAALQIAKESRIAGDVEKEIAALTDVSLHTTKTIDAKVRAWRASEPVPSWDRVAAATGMTRQGAAYRFGSEKS
jgi:hypothetical protein